MINLFLGLSLLAIAITAAWWISFGLGRMCIGWGERWGVVSTVTDRSSHTRPTSRLGGVALVSSFLLCAGGFVVGRGCTHVQRVAA